MARNKLTAKTDDTVADFLHYCLKHYETSEDTDFIKKLSLYTALEKIGENIGKLYNSLHHTSPLTYPNILSKDVQMNSFSKVTNIGTKVIQRAAKM